MTTLAKIALIASFSVSVLLLARFAPASAGPHIPAEHSRIDCGQCHSLLVQADDTKVSLGDPGDGCRKCHSAPAAADDAIGDAFHSDPNRSCTDCHSFHNTEMLAVSGKTFQFDFDNNSTAFLCYTCHAPGMVRGNLSPGHRLAKDLYHADSRYLSVLSPSQTCMVCHTSSSATSPIDLGGLRPPRFNEHTVHPISIKVVPGSGNATSQIRSQLDARLPLNEGRIECQSCHSLTSSTPKRLVRFDNSYDLCLACHRHNP